MPLRRRHRRWIAIIALLGLLFQQFAMAAYVCPLDQATAMTSADARTPPCHSSTATDKARCHQHCHPLVQTVDHAPLLSIPPAALPATTWLRHVRTADPRPAYAAFAIDARAAAPPLSVQYCTFQI